MTGDEFNVLNNLYDASQGRAQNNVDVSLCRSVRSRAVYEKLTDIGYIDPQSGQLTAAGLAAMQPYRVRHAVILAAGSASRFVPLSLEQPKGLYEVRGERLIERQIRQLREAGISDITVVLGYKKDMFVWLQEKYDVRLVFNPAYNVRNNIESLLCAKKYLGNSYVCVCDSYFTENPFHQFEFQSFYAGYCTRAEQDEMFVRVDPDGRILEMEKDRTSGLMLLGHSFWTAAFSEKFIELAEADRAVGAYDDKFWEWLVKDNLKDYPPFYFREFTQGTIFEFDYFEQLRQFDPGYASHAHSEIIRNNKLVFRCDEEDIADFRTVEEGLTNTSFIFQINGTDYIYRHPGDGTEKIIDRRNEKSSLIQAKAFGIDPTYIYMDVLEGWKISKYISEFREPDYASFEDSRKVIAVLRKLHAVPVKADYGMKPWEDALLMERLLREKDPGCFSAYDALKSRIERLYRKTLDDGVEKCFCHGDTYKPNWMILPDESVILIDWEYAGFSDPGIDVGYYIVDAMYEPEDAIRFIREYLGAERTERKEYHFLVYTAVIAWYWFVWALYRESCGAVIGSSLANWYRMAVRYSDYLADC